MTPALQNSHQEFILLCKGSSPVTAQKQIIEERGSAKANN